MSVFVRGLYKCALHTNRHIKRKRGVGFARRQVHRRRGLLMEKKGRLRDRSGQIGRRRRGGREGDLFFMSSPSVFDTVAINRRSAEEWLFIRSISQSEHIKKPMKP